MCGDALEVTYKITNVSEVGDGIAFYGLPVIGEDWYNFFDNEVTSCVNDYFKDEFMAALAVGIKTGHENICVVVYDFYGNTMEGDRWRNIENEKMWIWVSMGPKDQRILLEF